MKTFATFNYIHSLVALTLAFGMTACDSGDIYPKVDVSNAHSVVVNLSLSNTETIPEGRSDDPTKFERKLALLVYNNNTLKSFVQIKKTDIAEGDTASFTLQDVPNENASELDLAITDQNNNIIHLIKSWNLSNTNENVTFDTGNKINLVSYARVQNQLFNESCTTCHSSSGGAAGLSLDASNSYSRIVNKKSNTDSEKNIVSPNDASSSQMYLVLTRDDVSRFNHTTLSTLKDNDVQLLKTWIESGATQD